MEFAIIVWFISSLGGLYKLAVATSILSCLLTITLFLYRSNLVEERYKDIAAINTNTSRIKKVVFTCMISAFLASAIPSEKTGWMMLGAYAAQTTWQSSTGQKLQKIAEIKLEEVLDEVTKQAKIKASDVNATKEKKE